MTTHEQSASSQPKRVTVVRGPIGWEVREEREGQVVRSSHYTDWHRVERALARHDAPAPPVPRPTS
jgi:hypothetical protein